jgi:hypothetical protein
MGIFIDSSVQPPIPKIGLELFRESYEDYEYLWLANGKTGYPRPYQACTREEETEKRERQR